MQPPLTGHGIRIMPVRDTGGGLQSGLDRLADAEMGRGGCSCWPEEWGPTRSINMEEEGETVRHRGGSIHVPVDIVSAREHANPRPWLSSSTKETLPLVRRWYARSERRNGSLSGGRPRSADGLDEVDPRGGQLSRLVDQRA